MSARNTIAAASRARKQKLTQQAADVSAYYSQIRERNVQKIIVDFLEKSHTPYMRNRDVKLVQTADGKLVPARLAESQKGKPDLTVVALGGKTIWIETKAPDPKSKLRPEQERWREALEKRGHEYYAPRTPAEAEAVCRRILGIGR